MLYRRYIPGWLHDIIGLSKETLCHWKHVLPALSSGMSRKRASNFSPGGVLTIAVLYRLAVSCGVRVDQLIGSVIGIFETCNKTSWNILADRFLVLSLSEHDLLMAAKSNGAPVNDAGVICPLKSPLTAFRDDPQRSPRSSTYQSPMMATDLARRRETGKHS